MGRLYQLFGFFCCICVFSFCWSNTKGDKIRKSLPVAFLLAFFFIWIHAKSISIPALTYLLIGGFGFPALAYGLLFRYEILLVIAALYIPHNAILPADFGGLFTGLNGTNIVLIALFLGMFVSSSNSGKRYPSKSPANVLVLIFCATIVLAFVRGAFLWGGNYSSHMIFQIKRTLTPMILYLIFVHKVTNRGIIRVIGSVLMIVVVFAYYLGILEWVELGFGTYAGFKRRLGSLNKHPNNFGAFIAYYIGLFWGPALVSFRRFSGKLLLFPVLMGMRLILPTNSRGAWISLPPAILTVAWFRSKLLAIVLVVLLVLPFVLYPSLIPETITARFSEAARLDNAEQIYASEGGMSSYASASKSISVRTRYMIMVTGLKVWRQNIFFGQGYGSFAAALRSYSGGAVRGTAHNGWLNLLVETGLVCVGSLLSIFGYFLYCAWKVFRQEKNLFLKGLALGYFGTIPAILVANLTGQRIDHVDLTAIFWIFSALIVKLRIINQVDYKESGKQI